MATTAKILMPYQIFDPKPTISEFLEEDDTSLKPSLAGDCHVIALSGPPGVGKTVIADFLLKAFGSAAVILRPSGILYSMMRYAGMPQTHLPYHEFKKLELGRERLIAAAAVFRKEDSDIFAKVLVRSEVLKDKKVVILDNVGFEDETLFYSDAFKTFTLLEAYTPHNKKDRLVNDLEYGLVVDVGGNWPGDSRFSQLKNVLRLKKMNVRGHCFYDSLSIMRSLLSSVFLTTNGKPDVNAIEARLPSRYDTTIYRQLADIYISYWKPEEPAAAIKDLFE
jgi:tRNA A37 threonylcarbamoyladenosine biosynthesis protein TsaE